MTPSNLQARRATVDDLAELRQLWREGGLPISELEKQLKDFQVVETPEGQLLGAVALQVHGQQGKVHGEAFREWPDADALRQRLWERARAVARNYGLHQVWTEEQAPFWRSEGFEPALPDTLKKLPAAFGEPSGSWMVLKLREESPPAISLEREFDLFAQAQRESSERLVRQAQLARNIAYLILTAVVVLGIILILLAIVPGSKWSALLKRHRAGAAPATPARAPIDQPAPANHPAPPAAPPR